MSDIIFVNGLSAKKPHENAPDFVKANLSVKVASLHEWLNENQGLANDAGFINLTLKESKAGKWYIAVDNYTPKKQNNPNPREEHYTPSGGVSNPVDDEVPF